MHSGEKQEGLVKLFAEVYDGIIKLRPTFLIFTSAPCGMITTGGVSLRWIISNVIRIANSAYLQVCIAVYFGDSMAGNTTFPMQSVNILGDNEFEN